MHLKRIVGTVLVMGSTLLVSAAACSPGEGKAIFQAGHVVEETAPSLEGLGKLKHLTPIEITELAKARDAAIAEELAPAEGLTQEQLAEILDDTCQILAVGKVADEPSDEQLTDWLSAAGLEDRHTEMQELVSNLVNAHNSPDDAAKAAQDAICYWASQQP